MGVRTQVKALRGRRFRRFRRPSVEWLDRRTLLAFSPLQLAPPLQFNARGSVQVTHDLATSSEVDLYAVTLNSGDTINVNIEAQQSGSALASLLRIFSANGTPLALDDQQGGDPHLSFQAATAGTYYIGVSSAPNDNYNPAVLNSGTQGGTTGQYELDISRTAAAPLMPDLTGSSFRTGVDMAAAGDTVPVSFTVENRGGADPGRFQIQVLLSDSNLFGSSSQVLATFTRTNLIAGANGRDYSLPAGFSVTVPSGEPSGSDFIGVRIIPDPTVPEAGLYDKSGVHRGVDWEPLTIVSRAAAGATDLAQVDAGLRTELNGTILDATQEDTYTVPVSATLGNGELIAEVAGNGGLSPRLTLSGPNGQVLIQSDSGRLVQELEPGNYALAVLAAAGVGTYRLTTSFVAASPLLSPLATGTNPKSVALGDLTNNGILDLVAPNFLDGTVSVFLGNGDGTFQPPEVIDVGPFPASVTLADLTGNGKLDIITANKGDASVSVLLGNGDGTFQPETEYAVGQRPSGIAVADLNGDGTPDLVVSNYRDGTVSILLGNGNGTFQPQEVDPVGLGPGKAEVVDLNGDGIPDIVTPNYSSADVSVLLGNGDGTFQSQQTYPAGKTPYSITVADFNGDGKPDLAVTNYVANTVSVLLNAGNGTFLPERAYATGLEPYAVTAADVNGDGKEDLIVANWGDNTVGVLLGNGDGTFQAQEAFPVGANPHQVAVGDVNGDGKLDIITANKGDNNLSILLGNGDGTFQAQQAAPAPAPSLRPLSVAVADLNGDGRPDIVTANRGDNSVSVLLQNADGTFQTRQTFPTGSSPNSVAVADLTGDGIPDIVTADYGSSKVSVLLGNGDGTFQAPRNFAAGATTYAVTVADLRGDGKEDIITANKGDASVSVLLGNGDGTFQPQQTYSAGPGVDAVAVADVNGDGIPDIVTANFGNGTVSVLLGKGDGTFQPAETFAVGANPSAVAVADLNGDGKEDIITADYGDSTVSVLLGTGKGAFLPAQTFATGTNPDGLVVGDFNGDGIPDIATANYGSGTVSVLLGTGNGAFGSPQSFEAGSGSSALAVGDLNRDGKLDLAVSNRNDSTVSLLLGTGAGTFAPQQVLGLGKNKYSVTTADVNGDGKPDLITTSLRQSLVSVQLGNGTGTFQQGVTLPVGLEPTAVAVADLNGDGRPDLVTTNSDGNSVSVLLGNGDGTFLPQQTFPVGRDPRGVVVGDVNGDGIPDIITANYDDDTVSVLLGRGDGTFQPQAVFAVGERPYAVALATLSGDGIPDIIVTNVGGDSVSVLMGRGDGTFQPAQTFPVGRQPFALAVADLNGDGIPDIVTANFADNTVSLLLGKGDGTFQPQTVFSAGTQPSSVVAADVNGDGKTDLVTTDEGDNDVSLLLNNGLGSFQAPRTFTTDQEPIETVVADLNGDGRPDLVTVSNHDSTTSVLLGSGAGSFLPATAATAVGLSDTPFLVDLNGDGIPDSVILDRSGNILFRAGLGGASNSFAPPVILNPGRPARDIAIVRIGLRWAVAAADAHSDPQLSTDQFVFTVSIYTISPQGAVTRATAFSTTALPVRLAVADLTGDGQDDLIAANSLDNSVTIALQTAPGRFATPITIPVGITPSDITVADVNGDSLPDIVVSDQSSGDVAVLLNDPAHTFSQTLRFRDSTEPDTLGSASGSLAENSIAQSVGVVAGDVFGTGQTDLVVVNRGEHSFTVLSPDGHGGFQDPQVSLTTSTSDGFSINDQPGAVVAGDFNRDNKLDLAVLMEDTGQVWIYTGQGNGTFVHTFSIPVGDEATGLSVVPGAAPGLLNLLVGNGYGDVLILDGKGDGTFQISGKRVSLSVVPDLLGPGEAGVLVGDQQNDRVTVQAPSSNGSQYTTVQTLDSASSSAQMAPGDVEWAVLDKGATVPDAIVVSTGSNAVVVYQTLSVRNGVPTFAPSPRTYFVGTAPASVTVADINGDGIPDMLIANQGSNDVSVLFGSYNAAGAWVGIPGPRLKSGGDGPIEVVARDLTGNGVLDLAVINGGSGTVTMLPGVGLGFFDDRQPRMLFNLGGAVVQPPTFVGNTGVGFAVTASGSLVRFDLDNPGGGARVVYSGRQVLAAQALSNGQVVVVLANGAVQLLVPQGEGLSVSSALEAEGGIPAAPSTLDVVKTPNGQFQVLVSSQGSDTIFVYAQAGIPTAPVTGSQPETTPSGTISPTLELTAGSPVLLASITNSASTSSSVQSAISASVSTVSSSMTSTVSLTAGLSLGSFSSLGNPSSSGSSSALLVSVEGNSYLSVPVLDFGSEHDEEEARGASRMPSLASKYPISDTAPLTRLVVGIEEALREYRGSEEVPLPVSPDPLHDPWNEDLFAPHQQGQSEMIGPERNEPSEFGGPRTLRSEPDQAPLSDGPEDEEALDPGPVSRIRAGLQALAGLVAGLLMIPAFTNADRETQPNLPPREPHR